MSGFLANLAGLALGVQQPGAARLALPPRFGGGVVTDTGLEAETVVHAVMGRAVAMAATSSTPTEQPATGAVQSYGSVQPAHRMPRSDEEVVRRAATGRSQAALAEVVERSTVERPHTSATQASRQQPEPFERRGAEAPRTVAPLTTSRTPPARSAPISPAALASRVTAERELRPVVTITIDRIEVRAPREALPQPPARRPRPEPSQSLADYLEARP
ncbi:hypothetical protein [Mesorhizobium sp. 1B3]|uniref:hypothetical protein n=1 Tax=Mesorhizobium sp. 1B3 TaxID=3243599 RepID=UPI003D97B50C